MTDSWNILFMARLAVVLWATVFGVVMPIMRVLRRLNKEEGAG